MSEQMRVSADDHVFRMSYVDKQQKKNKWVGVIFALTWTTAVTFCQIICNKLVIVLRLATDSIMSNCEKKSLCFFVINHHY